MVEAHSPLMAARAAGLAVTYTPGHDLDVGNPDKSHIPSAVSAARAADVAIVMIGLCADHCAGRSVEDEGFDRGGRSLGFPGAQQELLEAGVYNGSRSSTLPS